MNTLIVSTQCAAGSSYGANFTSNHEELSDFLNNCYAKISAETTDLCAALQQRLKAISNCQSLIHQEHGDSSLEAVERVDDALQSFSTVLDGRLKSLNAFKMVSAVFFAAAAAITAAVAVADPIRPSAAAAAAASVLLIGVGNWVHSRMKKRESAVEKRKTNVGVMSRGTKICRKDLTDIHALAQKLQLDTDQSMSENADDEKTAALMMVFEELRRKADEYSRDVNWVLEELLKSIIDQ